MDLPKEIKQLIAAYLGDQSVLKVRLVDKSWFNSIKNIHFPVFMPRSDTLPLIINSLSRYNNPISLTIHKPIRIPLCDFIEQVSKLSSLTSLTFPYFSDFEYDPSHPDQPEWHLLTNLARLRAIKLLKPIRLQLGDRFSAPEGFLRALAHLPHLATLQLTNCYNYTSEQFSNYMTLLTRLEEISVPMVPNGQCLPPLMSSHLTRLCLSLGTSMISANVNEVKVFHNLKELQLLGINVPHLSLTELGISSLVTLEVSAKRVTGLDNNTNLRRLLITAHEDTLYDQMRKLVNLERLTIWTVEDPGIFNEFKKLTNLCIIMQHQSFEVWDISSSVKTLELNFQETKFNYKSLAVLTSLDSLTISTYGSIEDTGDFLPDISTLTDLTRLTVETNGDDLTLANLSTLTNLERFHTRGGGSLLWLQLSFLPHLTNLSAFSNNRLREEHYSEIATLTRLTHLACLNADNERGNFSVLSHLPLKILAAEVLEEDLNSFLQATSTMTTLELLGIFEEAQQYSADTVMRADWSSLSSLTRLTRLDLNLHGLTRDTLTPLTRVTSLQFLNVMRPDENQQDNENIRTEPSLDDWIPFATQSSLGVLHLFKCLL